MGAIFVVVGDVIAQKAVKMTLVQDYDVVEELSSNAPDPSLCDAILLRTPRCRPNGRHAARFEVRRDLSREGCVAIEDHVAHTMIERKRFANLLDYPRGAWRVDHIEVQDSSSAVLDREPYVQHSEGDRRDHEEVHRRDRVSVIAEECSPALDRVRLRWPSSQVPRDRALRDIEAQHPELSVDARSAPARVLGRHALDELPNRLLDPRLTGAWTAATRQPRPVSFEAGPVPADHCFRLHHHEHLGPPRPDTAEQHPEETITCSHSHAPSPTAAPRQHGELLSEG
jgi:hypothetical protein